MNHKSVDPNAVIPRHDPSDDEKLNALMDDMWKHGWQGRPLLVASTEDGLIAVTGNHRLVAAACAELKTIPVYVLNGREHQLGLDGYCGSCGIPCWFEGLMLSENDSLRLCAIEQSGDQEAIKIMRAEFLHERST